ncbi:MAG: hypothetical protein FJ280_02165 [Planctomycetes bacterium]|nr:hypothetical protein [Planctomycetota bacterium]
MRRTQQGKLDAKTWIVLAVGLAFYGFLFLATKPRVRRPQPNVYQKAQFNALNAVCELFANEFEGYPPSEANDPAGQAYCGAMKLAEATMGQDLFGFHTKSIFRRDGLGVEEVPLYPADMDALPVALRESSRRDRQGPFLQAENANAWRLSHIYGAGNTGPFAENTFVLCDVYPRVRPSGEKPGMPILYYRAHPSGTLHDVGNPDNPQNIYHYQDNHTLVLLGVPGQPGVRHPLADPKRFYLNTLNRKSPSKSEPHRRDSFILISAGSDGLYGTADDVCNFEWKYRER